MAVVKWTFSDPVTIEVHTFEINPSEGAQPGYEKNVVYEATAAAQGQTLVYEGRRAVQRLEWKGFTQTLEQHETFIEWFEKGYQIDITDDLGNEFRAYITAYQPERKRSIHFPERRDYSMSAVVVNT